MRLIIASLITILTTFASQAQLAVKTNLLTDAMTTPNLGAELRIGKKSTVNLVYGINPWTFTSDNDVKHKAKHWVLMPEYRWWFCSPYNGHFLGVHALGGQMNVQNAHLPVPGGFFGGANLTTAVRDSRVQGGFVGAGVTYGYQWILAKHWNLEAEIGAGYGHVWYDRYSCGECGTKTGTGDTNYAGLTKLGVSILYLF